MVARAVRVQLIVVQAVAVLSDGCLHGRDAVSRNAAQLNDWVEDSVRHLIQVEGDGGIVDPRSPVPWPLEVLARVEEDRYAAK